MNYIYDAMKVAEYSGQYCKVYCPEFSGLAVNWEDYGK